MTEHEHDENKNDKNIVIYPFFFAIYTTLFLFVHNIREVYAGELIAPLLIITSFITIIFFSLNKFLKNSHKTGMACFLMSLFFFSYGIIFSSHNKLTSFILKKIADGSISILLIAVLTGILILIFLKFFSLRKMTIWTGLIIIPLLILVFIKKNRIMELLLSHWDVFFRDLEIFLLIFWFVCMVLTIIVCLRKFKELHKATRFLNSLSIFLFILLFLQGSYALITLEKVGFKDENIVKLNDLKEKPDIYYIILDEYGGKKALNKNHDFNNSDFLDLLGEKGFYVAEESFANYLTTTGSIPSSLNINYLHELIKKDVVSKTAAELVQNSKVMKSLKNIGYKIIHFSSGFNPTEPGGLADIAVRGRGIKMFHKLLMETTMLKPFFDPVPFADNVLSNFEFFKTIPKIKEPTFAFAHFVSPHHPYVFDRHGNRLPPDEDYSNKEKYIEQLMFINNKIIEVVDSILENSEKPPIIIIQSDHGHNTRHSKNRYNLTEKLIDRAEILNAYYFPDKKSSLYPNISPVNSFRVLFNEYFEAGLDLLPDKTYRSSTLIIENKTVVKIDETVNSELQGIFW